MLEFYLPTRMIFGRGSLAHLGAEAKKMGRRALLVIDRNFMNKTGAADGIVGDLNANGLSAVMFDKVEPNPRAATIDEGARLFQKEKADVIVGIGGGSTMDASKGMAVAGRGSEPIWRYVENKAPATGPRPPLILVPTVAASGSEANGTAVITNWETREKRLILNAFADLSIVDPTLTLTLPKRQTAQGGFDIFAHLLEPYITLAHPSPLADGIRETAMRMVITYLPRVLDRLDDIEARTQLSWASVIGSGPLSRLGEGMGYLTCHVIEHPFSGRYDMAHADGLAALLPAWMKYTFSASPERFQSLGKNVFGETDGIGATVRFMEKVGMKLRLRDLGVEPERIDAIAEYVARNEAILKFHPNVLDAAAIARICRDSY